MKHVASSSMEQQLFALSTLVQLVKRARHAVDEQELGFVTVNETHALVPYRQAALWRSDGAGTGKIVAVSGAPVVERGAPMTLWLHRAFAALAKSGDQGAVPHAVDASNLPEALREEWAEWLPTYGLYVPLGHIGVLLLVRDQTWGDGERHLIQELADGYASAWATFLHRRHFLHMPVWRPSGIVSLQ